MMWKNRVPIAVVYIIQYYVSDTTLQQLVHLYHLRKLHAISLNMVYIVSSTYHFIIPYLIALNWSKGDIQCANKVQSETLSMTHPPPSTHSKQVANSNNKACNGKPPCVDSIKKLNTPVLRQSFHCTQWLQNWAKRNQILKQLKVVLRLMPK